MNTLYLLRTSAPRAWSALRILPLLAMLACIRDKEPEEFALQEAYRPVYASYEEIRSVHTQTPRPLAHVGKIYVKDHYVFINEINEGIHIIDNQNPSAPRKLSFIAIPANADIAVKGNVLYADNATDLVAIDISNPASVKLLNRVENVFPYQKFPPQTGVSFECVDPLRGVVVRWEKVQMKNPKCFR